MTAAHDVPSQLPGPQSAGEAWNVIEGSAANIDVLLDANLLRDITFQIANCDGSLRYLSAQAQNDTVRKLSTDLLNAGSDLISAIRDPHTSAQVLRIRWNGYREKLKQLESQYQPELLQSVVYICPMHPLDRHLKADEKCTVCGMQLIQRRLPASGVYEKPGAPTMKLSIDCSPLVVGKHADVKIHISTNDGKPVRLDDLLEMHTRKIHLLINDMSLSDYHHEHPTPTGLPGEYAFGFTPRLPGPYRIWADLVPARSSVQEYVIADIPAPEKAAELVDRRSVSTAVVNGRTYTLTLGSGQPIHAGQTVIGTIAVTGSDGKPFVLLEPVMGAFAHIVGFNEDLHTVLHIHPYSNEPTGTTDHAGPVFAFKFYAPKPGFYRLYGQVQIGGVSQFAPFGVTILPVDKPATQP